jgi:DNA-binding NtrC family response regulator
MAKILIVEDDTNISSYLATVILSTGHSSLAVDSAEKAQALLASDQEIALLILDHHLGNGTPTGLALLTAIRNSALYRHLPVIVCSGDTKSAAVSGFLALNIVDFMRKPFRPERLFSSISRVLGNDAVPPPSRPTVETNRIIRARR